MFHHRIISITSLVLVLTVTQAVEGFSVEPERVLHVNIKAANASDKNPGTETAPWKTLEHAGKTAVAGDKVIIHPGLYKGTLDVQNPGTKEKPIVFEGTELGKVILDGTEPVLDWKRSDHDPRIWEAASKLKLRKYPPQHMYSKYYSTADPRELNVDGAPLFFVSNLDLRPGSWTTNEKKDKLYARLADDSDPNQHDMTVIATMFGVDLQNYHLNKQKERVYPQFITVSNLHIRRYQGGIRVWGPSNTIENNIIDWCEMWGLFFNRCARDAVFKNNVVSWSGHVGAAGAHRVKFLNNKLLFSNWKLSSPGWSAAGVKTMYELDILYEGNECAYNASLGLWLDCDLQGAVIKNNILHDNVRAGIEDEAAYGNTFEGNVSYRNRSGFYCGNSSNDTIKNNIFADNFQGFHFRFNRSRRPRMLQLVKFPGALEKHVKSLQLYHSDERIERWLNGFMKYCCPCNLVRDNRIEKNLFLNNGVEVYNYMARNLPDMSEKYMISNNLLDGNVFINSNPTKIFAGNKSLEAFANKSITCEVKNSLYLPKLELYKLPAWAKSLYEKHRDRLDYPRSYMSILKIYESLTVRNPHVSAYRGYPAPAGMLALARICESEVLEKIDFSDKMLHAYRINFEGKPSLVLWREHGAPSDYLPVLLKGLPKETELETTWGLKMPIERKGDLASINVGTWPIYLKNCPGAIVEALPFSVKIPSDFPEGQPVKILIKNAIGDGELYVDSFYKNVESPGKIVVKNAQSSIELNLIKDDYGFVKLRLAGKLGGLYAGQMLRFSTKKVDLEKENIIQKAGFKPISIQKVANCSLKLDSPSELLQLNSANSSLEKIPDEIKVGKITFRIDKNSCIGLTTSRVKEKRPAMVSIPMGNKKYSYLAFLQVLAYAPAEHGADLFEYRLNYGDNFTSSVSMKNKINLFDWWYQPGERQKNLMAGSDSYCAWSGDNGTGHTVYVYAYIWKNPEPHKEIMSLDIGGGDSGKKNTLGILAVSGLELGE